MALVNKFNVNREQVTLDADIIENMSANDVSYDDSFQYDENTVGDKLSKLGQEVIYDVTANNNEATFASLSELLSSGNLSTLIPTSVRHGGMSIRFVQSSYNKYVQYRLMGQNFTTDITQWQGIDETPTTRSHNLVTSRGVKNSIGNVQQEWITNYHINLSGGIGTVVPNPTSLSGMQYCKVACDEGSVVNVSGTGGNSGLYGFIDEKGVIISWSGINVRGSFRLIAPSGTAFVVANNYSLSRIGYLDVSLHNSVYKDIYTFEDKLKGVEYSYKDKAVNIEWAIGKYIYNSGAIANNENYKYGTFEANSGDFIVVNVDAPTVGCIIGVKHSLEKSNFSPVVTASGQTQYSYVCETDCYVGISGLNNINFNYRVFSSRIDSNLQRYGTMYATKRLISPTVAENAKYRTYRGSIASLGGYAYTVPIFLKKGTFVSNNIGVVSSNCSVISEVSENNEFLRYLYLGDNVAGVKEYVIDKTGYYSFSCRDDRIDYFVIVEFANGDLFFNNPLDNLFLNMESQTVPPREILRSPSFVGIVHKWGFIGDSLSSGEQAVHNDETGTLERFDLYDYSWGQRLCRLNSVNGFNFSVGGQTAKGWCNGVDERTWTGAKQQENWKEAYCIALGVNDRSAPYPKGDADTDIDLSDYNNNADTFAGWYAGIIQRLQSVNPKCRIFCITIPYNNQQGYLDNNEVIRAIVPKFNRCYLVDLANYHWTPSGLALNDHLSPAGYQWAAFEINTYIDWIIRNNMDDFKDIAWVGTEYSA